MTTKATTTETSAVTETTTETTVALTEVQQAITAECRELETMLIEKNRNYGNSALEPLRVFSKASAREQILVRLDDKLSRLSRGAAAGEDVIKDMLGYLILLRVADRMSKAFSSLRQPKLEITNTSSAAPAYALPNDVCPTCKGSGWASQTFSASGDMTEGTPCTTCLGRKRAPKDAPASDDACPACKGRGWVSDDMMEGRTCITCLGKGKAPPSGMPSEIDIDGHIDHKGVKYIGAATWVSGNLYRCLANVGGCLCVIEATIQPRREGHPAGTSVEPRWLVTEASTDVSSAQAKALSIPSKPPADVAASADLSKVAPQVIGSALKSEVEQRESFERARRAMGGKQRIVADSEALLRYCMMYEERLSAYEALASRLSEWALEHGEALKPRAGDADSFGDGMRAAKREIKQILSTKIGKIGGFFR